MKKLSYIALATFLIFKMQAQSVTVTKSGGWFETAFAEWELVRGADRYNVYYSGNGVNNQQIDNQLIRSYGSYMRADIPGLAAGSYTIKIVPIISGAEAEATSTEPITVIAHDRSGFAFSNGTVPGAYNADGTPKNGAIILYVTEETKNTISLTVTGASTNPCVGIQEILSGFKKGKDNRPLIIRMIGQITTPAVNDKGDIVVENSNNSSGYITFEGIGEDATADEWGIRIKNANNIEIRNIGIMNVISNEGDNIGLQQNNEHIWIHNCDFFYGGAGGDSDQAKGDGALDCKKSTYVTFSYNHFWDSGKSNLLGLSEGTTDGLFITYHHNWYDHSDSRHPRVRFYSAHVYNNYYDGNAKYGIGSTEGSSIFSEGNYFRNCKYPMLTSMQGSDVYDASSGSNDYGDKPTFSSEDGGTIKAFNNYMEGQKRFIPYGDPTVSSPNPTKDFDAYVVGLRNETVPNSVSSAYGGNTYNNFDVNASIMYTYSAQNPEEAKATVMELAGRLGGGDFTWTFNNDIDDASYAVNAELKSALVNYKSSLVYIQGLGEPINQAPFVTISSPNSNTTFSLGETITINATASDADGSVSNVAFYAMFSGTSTSTEISDDNSAPYSATWNPEIAGSYVVYCKVTDNKGKTGLSDQNLTIIIDDPTVNDAPSVSVSTDQHVYSENSDIVITATASDDNAIEKVEFFNGEILLASKTSEPYTYTLQLAYVGSYTITAVATDNEGLSNTSTCTFTVEEINVSDLVHNFTESGMSSNFFTISGNLSDSKGTVGYNGLTLTQCLKLESSTSITFTTAQKAELTLVFNEDFSEDIKVDGSNYTATNGIVTIILEAGEHTISKANIANLYYMSIAYMKEEIVNTSQNITLKKGWNLVSVFVQVSDNSIQTIFPNALVVKTMDSFWDNKLPSDLQTLKAIETGQGYLVYNTDDEQISIEGKAIDNNSYQVKAGWHLIGISNTATINDYFDSEIQSITTIKDFDAFWKPDESGTLERLDAGKAYYIKSE